MTSDPKAPSGFASPPCYAHELELDGDAYVSVDPQTAIDVARWRKAKRKELIAARLALPAAERKDQAERIAGTLERLIEPDGETILSAYWPFKGEIDLRPWLRRIAREGVRVALPVVVAKGAPLRFRRWTPGARLERGIWNIPVPADGEEIAPQVTIAPLVGFDPDCYRLGYGGGYYDRTLAAMSPRPRVIGVGHGVGALATIFPQPHDIPMDAVVTGDGLVAQRQR